MAEIMLGQLRNASTTSLLTQFETKNRDTDCVAVLEGGPDAHPSFERGLTLLASDSIKYEAQKRR